jgi:GTPase SAR1 family protein
MGDKKIRMQIWDQSGQSRFKTITTSYYRNSNGIFILFNLTDKRTFEDAQNWYT